MTMMKNIPTNNNNSFAHRAIESAVLDFEVSTAANTKKLIDAIAMFTKLRKPQNSLQQKNRV